MVSGKTKEKKIFISHIHEEAEVAKVLKEWIESTFSQSIDVFVSSDPDDNPAGTRWLNKIEGELQELDLLIILCSAMSVGRPWINFEAGASWIKKVPIIPFCYLGMQKDRLPRPLSDLQAIDFEEANSFEKLMRAIAKQLKLIKPPKLAYDDMKGEIETAMGTFDKPTEAPETQIFRVRAGNKLKLNNIEEKILILIAANEDNGITSESLASSLITHNIKVVHYLEKLVENNLLWVDHYHGNAPADYFLTKEGRAYLVENDLLG